MSSIRNRGTSLANRKGRAIVGLVAVVAIAVAAFGAAWRSTTESSPDAENSSAAAHGVRRPRVLTVPDSAPLARAATRAAELPRLRSLLVAWKGDVILERYFHGASASAPANIKSASKTIMSALIGIAIQRGDLRPTHTLGDLLPADTRSLDTATRNIT